MRCKTCKRPMSPLFTSMACDWCDGVRQPPLVARGWVIWRADPTVRGKAVYVFPSREMAEKYQKKGQLPGDICEVVSENPFPFVRGKGLMPDLELADRLVTVYPDHRFEPGPYRAFLASALVKAAA